MLSLEYPILERSTGCSVSVQWQAMMISDEEWLIQLNKEKKWHQKMHLYYKIVKRFDQSNGPDIALHMYKNCQVSDQLRQTFGSQSVNNSLVALG